MNFLGHLYFSGDNPELMYCNLFGDFVKGRDLSQFPDLLAQGIQLHRNIDSYIDNHPAVLELRHELSYSLNRFTSIAIDLFFDHLLARNWSSYIDTSLRIYCDTFYRYQSIYAAYFSDDFKFLLDKMKEGDWIYNYQFAHGLEFACRGLSKRINFENDLYKAPEVFLKHEQSILRAFNLYMADAVPHFKNIIESIKQ